MKKWNFRKALYCFLFLIFSLISSSLISSNSYQIREDVKIVSELSPSNEYRLVKRFDTNNDSVNSLEMSSDGRYIVAGIEDKIYYYDRHLNEHVWNFEIGDYPQISISNEGNYIAAGSINKKVYVFSSVNSTPLWEYKVKGDVSSIKISSDGNYIIASGDNRIYLFDRNNVQNPLIWSSSSNEKIKMVDISADGEEIIACSVNILFFYQRWNSNPIWQFRSKDQISSIDISSNCNRICLGNFNGQLHVFNKSSNNTIFSDNLPRSSSILSLEISRNEKILIVGSYSSEIRVYNLDTPKYSKSYVLKDDQINSISISSTGKYLIACTVSSKIHYMDIDYNQPVWEREINGISKGLISSNGMYVCYGSSFKDIIFIKYSPPKSFEIINQNYQLDTEGHFSLNWTSSEGSDSYTIYYSKNNFSLVDDNVIKLKENVKDLGYEIFNHPNGTFYFAVLGINDTGSKLSNSIKIEVDIPEMEHRIDESLTIEILIMIIFSMIIVLIVLKYKLWTDNDKNKKDKTEKDILYKKIKDQFILTNKIQKKWIKHLLNLPIDEHGKLIKKWTEYFSISNTRRSYLFPMESISEFLDTLDKEIQDQPKEGKLPNVKKD